MAKKEEEKDKAKQKPAAQSREASIARKRSVILENEIKQTEEKLAGLESEMAGCAADYERLELLLGEKRILEEEITGLYARWEETIEQSGGL
jgi:predicted  nucleic acid-binding Zn-ribbon protein